MSELGEITASYNIRYVRDSKHPVGRVWRAITDADEVSKWMGYPARIDLRIGGDYFADFHPRSSENLDGVIVRLETERRLAYVWGLSVLEWTLAPEGDGCRYTFVHHGMIQRNIPDEEGVAIGWHEWLDDLENHLSGTPASPETRAEYAETRRRYREAIDRILST